MVNIGIIGLGNMGRTHTNHLLAGEVENTKLTAVCDIDAGARKWFRDKYGDDIKVFENYKEMYASGLIDAVLIATWHYDHPLMAIDAFEAGLHVLIEKPAGVYTKQVREMNEAAAKSGKVFSIMYNQRVNSVYIKIRDLIQSGELGEIKRINWIVTSWYRPQAYHDSSSWRSTWKDEGGGVLINQCPHNLDLLQWIGGMPTRIRAFVSFGKYYDIEVEDDVTAFLEYENGATGVFIASTGESPGTNRLEIAGDMGKIVIDDNKLTFSRNRVSEREFNKVNTSGFEKPECWECDIPVGDTYPDHNKIIRDFSNSILTGSKLLSPGEEGILGLTISNAIHLSAWTDDYVTLPMDEELFYNILQDKIKNSTFVKKSKKATFDLGGSYS